jgi:hypothetical protein
MIVLKALFRIFAFIAYIGAGLLVAMILATGVSFLVGVYGIVTHDWSMWWLAYPFLLLAWPSSAIIIGLINEINFAKNYN